MNKLLLPFSLALACNLLPACSALLTRPEPPPCVGIQLVADDFTEPAIVRARLAQLETAGQLSACYLEQAWRVSPSAACRKLILESYFAKNRKGMHSPSYFASECQGFGADAEQRKKEVIEFFLACPNQEACISFRVQMPQGDTFRLKCTRSPYSHLYLGLNDPIELQEGESLRLFDAVELRLSGGDFVFRSGAQQEKVPAARAYGKELRWDASSKRFKLLYLPWELSQREVKRRRSECLMEEVEDFDELYDESYVEDLPHAPLFVQADESLCDEIGVSINSYCKPREDIFIITNKHGENSYSIAVFQERKGDWRVVETPMDIRPEPCYRAELKGDELHLFSKGGLLLWKVYGLD